MVGLEVMYHGQHFAGRICCPQDALVCFVHWQMIEHGFRCVGSGDTPRRNDRQSELLPVDWSINKDLYSLRYRAGDSHTQLLLKAVVVDSVLIFNLMNSSTQEVSDLTVNIGDHVDVNRLHVFDRVYKDAIHLSEAVRTQLLPPQAGPAVQRDEQRGRRAREDRDPLQGPCRCPRQGTQPHRADPIVLPFASGGADLDPFGSHGGGGMMVDPMRSGDPRFGFDPSTVIPGILPLGAFPPGARFDPFGPIGQNRPGPDPDDFPPPGYDYC